LSAYCRDNAPGRCGREDIIFSKGSDPKSTERAVTICFRWQINECTSLAFVLLPDGKETCFSIWSFTVSSYISGEMVSDNIQEALATDNLPTIVLRPCGSAKTN